MKTVLAFGAGVLVGVLLAFAAGMYVHPGQPGRAAAEKALAGLFAVMRAVPARMSAALDAVTAPKPVVLRRPVARVLRMTRTGVVLLHTILPDETKAAAGPIPDERRQTASLPSPEAAPAAGPETPRGPEPAQSPATPASRAEGGTPPKAAVKAGPESVYAQALKAYEAGRHVEARQRFAAFLKAFPGHALAPNALYWTGETWYDQGRYDLAAQAFARVLQEHPRHAKSPDALLKMAYAAMRQGRRDAARAYLDQLDARYPDSGASRLGRQARGRLQGRSDGGTMVAARG